MLARNVHACPRGGLVTGGLCLQLGMARASSSAGDGAVILTDVLVLSSNGAPSLSKLKRGGASTRDVAYLKRELWHCV